MVPGFAESEAVDVSQVNAIEEALGRPLPSNYRQFLADGWNGPPSPGAWGNGVDEVDVVEFYPPRYLIRMTDRADVAYGKLNIAECAAGDTFAIDLDDGSIFFREHEHPVDDRAGAFRKAAPSLDAFLAGFHEPSS
jgi:hypothetical protein